jgi:hypothetical protein
MLGYQRGAKHSLLFKSLFVAHRAARAAIPAIKAIAGKGSVAAHASLAAHKEVFAQELKPGKNKVCDQPRLRCDSDTTASDGSEYCEDSVSTEDRTGVEQTTHVTDNAADQAVGFQSRRSLPDEGDEQDDGDESEVDVDAWEMIAVLSRDVACDSEGEWEMPEPVDGDEE